MIYYKSQTRFCSSRMKLTFLRLKFRQVKQKFQIEKKRKQRFKSSPFLRSKRKCFCFIKKNDHTQVTTAIGRDHRTRWFIGSICLCYVIDSWSLCFGVFTSFVSSCSYCFTGVQCPICGRYSNDINLVKHVNFKSISGVM